MSSIKKPPAGRPAHAGPKDVVFITGEASKSLPQSGSDRFALLMHIVMAGGRATVQELSDLLGQDAWPALRRLRDSGWVGVSPAGTKLPRRTGAMPIHVAHKAAERRRARLEKARSASPSRRKKAPAAWAHKRRAAR